MLIKTIIIEDEAHSVYVLNDLIGQLAADLSVSGTAAHINSAVDLIESSTPDLIFMDVRIGDGTGFDVLRRLTNRNFELIFVTAFDSYALDAFRFSAIDYLLKPIGMNEFEEAVDRVRIRLLEKKRQHAIDALLHNMAQQNDQHKKINIATGSGYEFVELRDIVWCKSDNTNTIFHLADQSEILSSRNLGYYEKLLTSNNFCRIHHSIIINMQHIKSYVKGKDGYVVMTDQTELEISQRRKGEFLSKLML
ncbi:MAG TPA: LytTR family DNA-binding domain-containing protein [Niastella sp.]